MAKLALLKILFTVGICLATFQLCGEEVFEVWENDDLQTKINEALSCETDPEVRVVIYKNTIDLGNGYILVNLAGSESEITKLTIQGTNTQILFNQPDHPHDDAAIKVSGINSDPNIQKRLCIDNIDFRYNGTDPFKSGIRIWFGLTSFELINCSFSDMRYALSYTQTTCPVFDMLVDSCTFNQPQTINGGLSAFNIEYTGYSLNGNPGQITAQISNNVFSGVTSWGKFEMSDVTSEVNIFANEFTFINPIFSSNMGWQELKFSDDDDDLNHDDYITANIYDNEFKNWSIYLHGCGGSIYNNKFMKTHDNYHSNYYIDTFPYLANDAISNIKIYKNEFYGRNRFAINLRNYGGGLGHFSASIDYNSFFGSGGVLEIKTELDHLNGPQLISSFSNNLIACEGEPISNVSQYCVFNVWYPVNGEIHIDNVILEPNIELTRCVFESEDLYVNLNSFSKVGCYTENELYEVDYVDGTYNLLWTTEDKCKAINNGTPISELDILFDPDGTPPDIGAVYYHHYHEEYEFDRLPISGIHWMSFPVIDDRSYTAPQHWNELGYLFRNHMLYPANQIETASWSYGGEQGTMKHVVNIGWLNDYHLTTQPQGFKLKFDENAGQISPVLVDGFKADASTCKLELYSGLTDVFENWIGYFVPYTQGAGEAFRRLLPGSTRETYLDHIYAMKTQTWSTSRASNAYNSNWIVDPDRFTLSEGDMVAIKLLPNAPGEMYWKSLSTPEVPRTREIAENFSYTEELDYTPIFIEFDPNDLPDEVGLMVSGECKGAAVVDSSLIEVNYYASAAAKGEDEIEVMFYYGGKGTKKAPDTKVYNPETMLFEDGKLKASQLGDYGYISFNRSEGSTLVPLVTELKQNYPNPFKGITNISWILEKDEPISVDIYNLKGQKVKSFYNGLGKKGRQVLSWDAKDNNGQSVASGIYFYRLNTPEGSKVQKMMVMR